MITIEKIIRSYGLVRKTGLTHKRYFINQREDTRERWHGKRRF